MGLTVNAHERKQRAPRQQLCPIIVSSTNVHEDGMWHAQRPSQVIAQRNTSSHNKLFQQSRGNWRHMDILPSDSLEDRSLHSQGRRVVAPSPHKMHIGSIRRICSPSTLTLKPILGLTPSFYIFIFSLGNFNLEFTM